MPQQYDVILGSEEGNEIRVSFTGTVNGFPVAATLLRSELPAGAAASKRAKETALARAFAARPATAPSAVVTRVTLP